MPINTEVLDLFDFGDLFSKEEPIVEEEPEPVDETFEPTFAVRYSLNGDERVYDPQNMSITLQTNIPEEYQNNYNFEDLEMTLYKNDEVYQIIQYNTLVNSSEMQYDNDMLSVTYNVLLDQTSLNLKEDGFYDLGFKFDTDKNIEESLYKVAYRPSIDYVSNGSLQNNDNFIYKAFFMNEAETHLVPLYFSVKYPESITVEVRNRLYNTPTTGYGLSDTAIIPARTSISKLGTEHYGVFLYSNQFDGVIEDNYKAQLAISALTQTLIRLPHIGRISYFVDDAQVEGSLFDVELDKLYEQAVQSYVYLTEPTSTDNRYLVPVPVSEANIYDEVWSILSILKSGVADGRQWTQIIPPEAVVNNFIIEGTTITLDVNEAFVNVYKDNEEYQLLMMNSLMYSLTSIENITKVAISVEGVPLTEFAGYDLSEPLLTPPYVNFIGEY